MNNKIIGRYGEELAVRYLRRQGYEIIARNYQASYKEMDIVALSGGDLIFVEVKTRASDFYGEGVEAVGYMKQKALKKAIGFFLAHEQIVYRDARADLITININKRKHIASIKHYKNII